MDSVFLKKLLLKGSEADRKFYIYLHSEWLDHVTNLYVKDSSTGLYYKGQLVAKDFEEPAAELEIPLIDFRAECKTVFTSNIGTPGFEIELDIEKKTLRVNKNEQFCIQYLEIKLTEADKSYDMLDAALFIIDSGTTDGENQQSNEAMANLIEDVEQVLREKEEWKQTMLRKFLVVLNTKKDKINMLQKKLEKIDKRVKRPKNGRDKNNVGSSIAEEQMDQGTDEDSSSEAPDSRSEHNDFDAPTQRLTPPVTEYTDNQ